jgi:PKD repeat protein
MVYGTVWIVKPPVASFTYSPVPAIENHTTIFDASGSTPNGGSITSYRWDFDDGNITTTADPVIAHVYASHGIYNVTLTVEDSEGLTDSTWELVEVLRHDVAVVDVIPYRNWIYEGWSIKVNVTITNQGNFTETVTVDLYYNIATGDKIGTEMIALSPSETRTLTFSWDTTGVKPCRNYTMTAVADIPIESDMTNNVLESLVEVKVRIFGDTNGDDAIDIRDLAAAAVAFGSYLGHPGWNADVDLNKDNRIDIRDLTIIAKNFGKTC